MKWREDTIELEPVGKETFKLNDKQQLRKNKDGSYRIIYPIKINERIKWGNLFRINWTVLILLIALVLVMYNNNINFEECQKVFSDPYGFCEEVGKTKGGFIIDDVIGEEYPTNNIRIIE